MKRAIAVLADDTFCLFLTIPNPKLTEESSPLPKNIIVKISALSNPKDIFIAKEINTFQPEHLRPQSMNF
jgi:hypothetical protein